MKRCSVPAAVVGLVMSTLCHAAPTVRWVWDGQPADFVLDETDSRGLGAEDLGGSFGQVAMYFVGPKVDSFEEGDIYAVLAVGATSGVVYDGLAVNGEPAGLQGWWWTDWAVTGQWQSSGSVNDGTFSIDADEFVSFRVPEPGAALTLAIPALSLLRRRR